MRRKLSDTLASMTFKEKVDYIWEYYKIHILVSIFLITIVFITTAQISARKDTYLNIILVGNNLHTADVEAVSKRLNEDFLQQEDAEIQFTSVRNKVDGADAFSSAGMQRMTVQMAAGEIDLFVVDQDFFAELLSQGSLHSFNDLKGFNVKNIGNHEILLNEDGSSIYGIKMKNMKIFGDYEFAKDKVICIPANTRNVEHIVELLQYVLA